MAPGKSLKAAMVGAVLAAAPQSGERKGAVWSKIETSPLLSLLGEQGICPGKGLGWYLRLEEADSHIFSR